MHYRLVLDTHQNSNVNWTTPLHAFTKPLFAMDDLHHLVEHDYVFHRLLDAASLNQLAQMAKINPSLICVAMIDDAFLANVVEHVTRQQLIQGLSHAALVFTTQYPLKQQLEQLTGKSCIHVETAINLSAVRAMGPVKKNGKVLIITDDAFIDPSLNLWLRQQGMTPTIIATPRIRSLTDENNFLEHLSNHEYIFIPHKTSTTDWLLYAAALGNIVIGTIDNDLLRRCYAYTTCASGAHHPKEALAHLARHYANTHQVPAIAEFVVNNAQHKVESYAASAIAHHIIRHLKRNAAIQLPSIDTLFTHRIKKVHGPQTITLDKNQFAVCCVVKNGEDYCAEWLSHYDQLGVAHYFIVDNGSTDKTREFFQANPKVSLFSTDLPFKYYESEIRRFIVENYCDGIWCLSVDIDELFDYPRSDILSMSQFLEYQNQQGYTAVVGHLLDMFSQPTHSAGSLNDVYCYYDNSQIQHNDYCNHLMIHNKYNRVKNTQMHYLVGGVRQQHFALEHSQYLLLKHPLTFQDGTLTPHTDPHFCDKAKISDVTCVLFHYKFTDFSTSNIVARAQEKTFNYFANYEYAAYVKTYRHRGNLQLYSDTACKYKDMNELERNGFVCVSPQYIKTVNVAQRGKN